MTSFLVKYGNAPWLVFALVLAWKLALFLFTAQPVPSNDAFFYDGAVVHQLQHGGYFNPSLTELLPISSHEVFAAYPPLYQVVLYAWMSVFGTSVISAMGLHLALFAGYAVVVYRILKQLQTPVWCFHFAGLYLVLITFHDRPDSLAQLLGMSAIYCWIRSRRIFNGGKPAARAGLWLWLMALLSVLTFCTSLQIGGIYFLCLWFGMIIAALSGQEDFPVAPMAATVVLPMLLVGVVKFGFPHLWEGFMEHARQTPGRTGLRLPDAATLLKVARTLPGVFLVALLLPWSWFKQHNDVEHRLYARHEFVLLPALLGALGILSASLFYLAANDVNFANYLQPLIVACHLAMCASLFAGKKWLRQQVVWLSVAALLGSTRPIGMSTWGLLCARDVNCSTAVRRVASEIKDLPAGTMVVLSSAYLYDASKKGDLTLIHSDWLAHSDTELANSDLKALTELKPRKIILTQFDYYRRYQPILEQLKSDPGLREIHLTNLARVTPPDAYPAVRKVVQHISWAPVIVDLTWRGQD